MVIFHLIDIHIILYYFPIISSKCDGLIGLNKSFSHKYPVVVLLLLHFHDYPYYPTSAYNPAPATASAYYPSLASASA